MTDLVGGCIRLILELAGVGRRENAGSGGDNGISQPLNDRSSQVSGEWEWLLDKPLSETNAPFNLLPDQSQQPQYAARAPHIGKIVFSKQEIPDTADGAQLCELFELAEMATPGHKIHARAFWPRSIANYPLGRQGNKVLYGPATLGLSEHEMNIYISAFINGVQVHGKFLDFGAIGVSHSRGRDDYQRQRYKPGSELDFYAWNQSCKFWVLRDDFNDPSVLDDQWNRMAAKMELEFSKLPTGDHAVEFRASFQLKSLEGNEKRVFPSRTTPLSAPIACGTLTLRVPPLPVPRRSILPKASLTTNIATDDATRAKIEACILEVLRTRRDWGARAPKREIPVAARVYTDSYVCREADFVAGHDSRGVAIVQCEPTAYCRDFWGVFRRRMSDGWDREQLAFFRLGACTAEHRDPPKDIPPVVSISVGSSFFVDAELMSPDDEAAAAH